MGERRCANGVTVGNPEGKKTLGRPKCGRQDNIKIYLKEMGSGMK
jgi:hypothetical protein